MVLAALAVIALLAAGMSLPGLFLLTGLATFGVAGLFWRLRAVLVPIPVLAQGLSQGDAE